MPASDDLQVRFLADGDQSAESVAEQLTAFMGPATQSLDIAVYDCGLSGNAASIVSGALAHCAARGVAIRLAYFSGERASRTVPPPAGGSASFAGSIHGETKAITGFQALMHQKYVIRDRLGPGAAVWTGSTNWTVDSWTREENVIVIASSAPLAGLYGIDFDQLWASGEVGDTGRVSAGQLEIRCGGRPASTRVWFPPWAGVELAEAVGSAIRGATRRIAVASPVLTDGPILGALRDVVSSRTVPVRGVFDATQMDEVFHQWSQEGVAAWKMDAFRAVADAAGMAGKRSTPYGPNSTHDFMHLKAIVVDDVVFTGSYNFSRSGEENAENVLAVECADLAGTVVDFIDRLIQRYGTPGATAVPA
ncbi:MAG TPA: phospholipase D-like domain-containing protein [Chloroflexota bacterium]|nr:phospholipase D-like domain-containing protein [Chloroflexota bacterium]